MRQFMPFYISIVFAFFSCNAMEQLSPKKKPNNKHKKKSEKTIITELLSIQAIARKNKWPEEVIKQIIHCNLSIHEKHYIQNFPYIDYHWCNFSIPTQYKYLLTTKQITLLEELLPTQPKSRYPISFDPYYDNYIGPEYCLQSKQDYETFLSIPAEVRQCLTKMPKSAKPEKEPRYYIQDNYCYTMPNLLTYNAMIALPPELKKLPIAALAELCGNPINNEFWCSYITMPDPHQTILVTNPYNNKNKPSSTKNYHIGRINYPTMASYIANLKPAQKYILEESTFKTYMQNQRINTIHIKMSEKENNYTCKPIITYKEEQELLKKERTHNILDKQAITLELFFINAISEEKKILTDISKLVTYYSLLLRAALFKQHFIFIKAWNALEIPIKYRYLLTTEQINAISLLLYSSNLNELPNKQAINISQKDYEILADLPIEVKQKLLHLYQPQSEKPFTPYPPVASYETTQTKSIKKTLLFWKKKPKQKTILQK